MSDAICYERNIETFAVIDLETNNLPDYQFNKCGITELSIYAFSSQCLRGSRKDFLCSNGTESTRLMQGLEEFIKATPQVPELPRVLHKLTLMINPQRLIALEAEAATGLNNDMLCLENHFDEHTGDLLIKFLNRLRQPVCLVAHNGLKFDFPIIRHVMDNVNMKMPSSFLCVDSYEAFVQIDYYLKRDYEKPSNDEYKQETTATISSQEILQSNDQTNWQKLNETTPQRATKRVLENVYGDTPIIQSNAKRSLFQKKSTTPKSPKGFYKLGNIYERIFQQRYSNLHRAENDVIILSKLILHYGQDFLQYANVNAISFDNVKRLGSS